MSTSLSKITGYFGKSQESHEADSVKNDDSPQTDIQTPEFPAESPAVTPDDALTSSPMQIGISPCGESTGKKRIPSDSPSALTEVAPSKPRLSVLDDSLTNLFGADPSFEKTTPKWVPLMFASLDALREEVHLVSNKLDSFESFKTEVNEKVDGLEKTVDVIKAAFESMKEEFQSVKAENVELKETISLLANQVDHNEQHSRSECLLLHGVPESRNRTTPENSKILFAAEVSKTCGVAITEKSLKRAHRYGPPRSDGKPRPIIARFWDANVRNTVYSKKKLLKGKKFFISENLTKHRMKLLNESNEKYGKKNVWTREGRIYARDGDQVINIIS